MNLRFLETFVWAARLRKMTLVAQRLHATDATISARIAAFEAELGVKVFVREKGKQLCLTPEGAGMLAPAEELLALADAFTHRFAARDATPSQITIGMSGTVAGAILEPLVDVLYARWPDVNIHLPSLTSTDIRHKLLSGALDIGLLLGSINEPNVDNLKLLELDYAWVASPRLIPGNVSPSVEELKQQMLLSYPVDSDLFASVATYFDTPHLAGFKLNVLSSLSVMLRLACAGVGYAVLPVDLIRNELETETLRILGLSRPFPRQTYFASFIDLPSAPLRRIIAECIRDIARLPMPASE